jgi:hypothetical protein
MDTGASCSSGGEHPEDEAVGKIDWAKDRSWQSRVIAQRVAAPGNPKVARYGGRRRADVESYPSYVRSEAKAENAALAKMITGTELVCRDRRHRALD